MKRIASTIFLSLILMSIPTQLESSSGARLIEVFLSGDVMTGRGIDQVLPRPGNPELYEGWVKDARSYVRLAEEQNGPIPKPVEPGYIWGVAKDIWQQRNPDLRVINLETSITTSDSFWEGKGIHYRMNPENIMSLTEAGIDCCVLANNHVMDWGISGLLETLDTLHSAGIETVGAGRNLTEAWNPAVFEVRGRRVLIFAFGLDSAGVPPEWAAGPERAGVAYLPDLSYESLLYVKKGIHQHRLTGDHIIVSIHWGGNWGYRVPRQHRQFAHDLIDEVGVDVVYGHSSHHPRPLEIYNSGLILYGCGDFINDYEGISGYDEYRGDLTLMYFVGLSRQGGEAVTCDMQPLSMERFQLRHASSSEAAWITNTLNRESSPFGTHLEKSDTNLLRVLPK